MANKKQCVRGKLPVKLCDIEVCPKKRGNDCKKKKDPCEDPSCPTVQDKTAENAALDMEALEGILNNLTGLCQQPKCQAKPDEDLPCQPKTCPQKDPLLRQTRDFSGYSPAYAKIAKELQELKDLASQGLCRSPTCYNAYMGYYPPNYNPDCGDETCCANAGKGNTSCGGLFCPFKKGFKKPLDDGFCGNKTCPIAETREPLPLTSICGRDSCPFLPRTLCGNDECPYVIDHSYEIENDSVSKDESTCGGPKCPFARPNTPIGKSTCPYGGVPVCPYGGTVRTHKYSTDKGFVSEAARPYSGSASPYDYLGSLERNYANEKAQNYALFNYTTPPGVPPCPVLNKKKPGDCGKPTCISRGARMPDNFCVMKTCPWKNTLDIPNEDDDDGICGGPKTFSCSSPDVDYCMSPLCPIEEGTRQPRPSSEFGVCEGPKNYSCDQPDVDYCGSPTCLAEKPKETCRESTCPNLKKLVFCDECGGALPDKDIDFSEFENGKTESRPGEEYGGTEHTSIKSENTDMKTDTKHTPAQRPKEHVKVKKKDRRADILDKLTNCDDISVYSYPGTQIGHKYCNPVRPMIPKNMGWLWNSLPSWGKISRWRGYKPGAVSRGVFDIIQKHRRELGLSDDDGVKKKRSKMKFKMEDLKHCVEVKKRNGDYMITVNPVKDPVKTVPFENPFIDCSPILFKVEKDQTKKVKNTCPCDEDEARDKESTDSEFEFMFSPPAAIPDTRKPKKPRTFQTCHAQYDPKDIPGSGGKGKKGKKDKKKGKKKRKKTGKKIKITIRTISI